MPNWHLGTYPKNVHQIYRLNLFHSDECEFESWLNLLKIHIGNIKYLWRLFPNHIHPISPESWRFLSLFLLSTAAIVSLCSLGYYVLSFRYIEVDKRLTSAFLGFPTTSSLTLMCTCDVSFDRVPGVFHKAHDDAPSSVSDWAYSEVSLGDAGVSYIHGPEIGRHLGICLWTICVSYKIYCQKIMVHWISPKLRFLL